jgi:UDP-N-acetylglucosamine--N-acetylmuramyl-(pentapeptide) pyrophosphoryl-undecaprenol N-acetylglucosamine transferase
MNENLLNIFKKYSSIILVGGWTGWHIQPIVSIVKNLKNTNTQLAWIGWNNSEEAKVAHNENIPFLPIPILKLSTTKSFKILLYPIYLCIGFFKARGILKKYHSSDNNIAIFSKWWPGSIAIGIAGWSLGIPLYIHESDTIPGRSNRTLWRFAKKIFLGFEDAKKYFNTEKCEVVGQILDPVFDCHCEPAKQSRKITEQRQSLDRFVPRDDENKIHWKTSKPHILVICGSQWAKSIFDAIINQFKNDTTYEWIVALWKLNTNMQSAFADIQNCQAISWISQENIAHLIQDTDVAISRWSATTLAELTSNQEKIPKLIIIPLPYSAGNHQYYNAIEYEKIWHILLEQDKIKELKNTINKLNSYARNWTENK